MLGLALCPASRPDVLADISCRHSTAPSRVCSATRHPRPLRHSLRLNNAGTTMLKKCAGHAVLGISVESPGCCSSGAMQFICKAAHATVPYPGRQRAACLYWRVVCGELPLLVPCIGYSCPTLFVPAPAGSGAPPSPVLRSSNLCFSAAVVASVVSVLALVLVLVLEGALTSGGDSYSAGDCLLRCLRFLSVPRGYYHSLVLLM
jgi:hypothetical protein